MRAQHVESRQPGGAEMPIDNLTDRVSELVSETPLVGHAVNVLRKAGYQAVLAGNRITVEDSLIAAYTSANGQFWWDVYEIAPMAVTR